MTTTPTASRVQLTLDVSHLEMSGDRAAAASLEVLDESGPASSVGCSTARA